MILGSFFVIIEVPPTTIFYPRLDLPLQDILRAEILVLIFLNLFKDSIVNV
jgi:hypothetical protein